MKRTTNGLNLLLAVDKPFGMTSHDVVNRVRRSLGESRVGHAGTLDPFATGVMVVGVGQATRLMQYASAERKSYVARIAWGRETLTDDVEGDTRLEAPVPSTVLQRAWAEQALSALEEMTEQVPPAYSAVKVAGTRAYDAARRGRELELGARPVEVYEAALLDLGIEDGIAWWDVSFTVSKGTYIRALARDLGRACSSACHLSALRRTSSGAVGIDTCLALDEVGSAPVLRVVDPLLLLGFACVSIGEEGLQDVRCGRKLSAARTDGGKALATPVGSNVCLVRDDALYAVARRDERALVPVCVFQDGVSRRDVTLPDRKA